MAKDKCDKVSEITQRLRKETERKIAPMISVPPATLMALHQDAIHAIRKFAAGGHFGVIVEHEKPYGPYENLANCCRNAIVAVLGCQQRAIHCTIRRCKAGEGQARGEWEVWTFARSTVTVDRPDDFGPDCFRKIGKNSMFAALVGCKDNNTDWRPFIYRCFGCSNLPNFPLYADSDSDWDIWYRSALAFPIRYQTRWGEDDKPRPCILGFLTFDSLDINIFQDMPPIFDYIGEPADYERELVKSNIFHVGSIISDVIATAIMLERRLRRKEKREGVR